MRAHLTLTLLILVAANSAAQARPDEPKRVKLKEVAKLPPLLPGFGLKVPVPGAGWKAKLGRWTLLFLDLNQDGQLAADGTDGVAIEGLPFVVPLPGTLLLEPGQCELAFEAVKGDKLELLLTPQALPGVAPALVADAAQLTEMRIRAGVIPVTIDAEASRHCRLHAEYLKLNGRLDGYSGTSSHSEDPKLPGYTAEGAAAGLGSNLSFQRARFREALFSWAAQTWHGAPVVDPGVRQVGVALEHGVALLYPYGRGPVLESYLHPPHQAVDVQLGFSDRPEVPKPDPAVDETICGMPVMVLLAGALRGKRLTEATLTDARGRSVKGTFSCPQRPGNPAWPTNSGLALFLPSAALQANTRYKARFVFEGQPPLEWEFSTGASLRRAR